MKFHAHEIGTMLHEHNKIIKERIRQGTVDLSALEVCELGVHGWVPCPTKGHTFPYGGCLYRKKPISVSQPKVEEREEETDMKLCVDCKWCICEEFVDWTNRRVGTTYWCEHADEENINLVTGDLIGLECGVRRRTLMCGVIGNLWRPKE